MSLSARETAMNLLAVREHSTQELRNKLLARGFADEEIASALQTLSLDGLLSDERFVESFIHFRMQRGSGPVKIRAELRQRGVRDALIRDYLDERDAVWMEQAEKVRRKKFGPQIPADYRERARQARFLQYRGFTSEQTRRALHDDVFD